MASGGNEVRIVIRGDDDSRSAFREAERSTERLDQSLQDAAQSAAELGTAAEDSGDSIGSALGERASGFLDNLGGSAGGAGELLGKLGPVGKGAAAAIGVAMIAAAAAVKGLQAAISASIDRAAALGRMKAQLLLDPKDAAKYAKIAAKVYTDNWGESLEQASDYVRDAALYIMPTASQMDNAVTPSLNAVAERVAALSGTMDEEGKTVASAIKHMLTTGMASSVDEAFNLLHAGIAKGVDSAGDLLDTFIEYSTVFRELGLNGKQAMGLMSQGLEAGARDADTMADAIKEIGILVQDVSNTKAQDAFKSMGLDAKKLGVEFNAGGSRARAALDSVLQGLNAIEDPLKQRAIAVALFGTKAEDLGGALFNLDLNQAAKQFEEIGGAADTAAAHMSGNAYSALEAYRRKWEMFKADIGDRFLPVFQRVMDAIQAFADKVGPRVKAFLADLQEKWDQNRDKIAQFGDLMEKVLGFVGPSVIGVLILAVEALVNSIIIIGSAWERAKQAFATAVAFILASLGTVIHGAAAAFGWMPGIGPKLRAAANDFDVFAAKVNHALNSIMDKTVHVNVVTNAPVMPGRTNVGIHKMAASGGIRTGVTMVGERGPELIDLGAGGRVINNNTARRMATASNSGGGNGGSFTLRAVRSPGNWLVDAFMDAIHSGVLRIDDSTGQPVAVG